MASTDTQQDPRGDAAHEPAAKREATVAQAAERKRDDVFESDADRGAADDVFASRSDRGFHDDETRGRTARADAVKREMDREDAKVGRTGPEPHREDANPRHG